MEGFILMFCNVDLNDSILNWKLCHTIIYYRSPINSKNSNEFIDIIDHNINSVCFNFWLDSMWLNALSSVQHTFISAAGLVFFLFDFGFVFLPLCRAPSHKWIKAIKKSLGITEKSVLIEIENTSELFSFYSISVQWQVIYI